jgi:hypothetical protein
MKIPRFLLTALLLLGLHHTLLASSLTSGYWTYILNGSNEATITSYNGPGGAVVIPGTINERVVKTIGSGTAPIFGDGNTTVTSALIPNSVNVIAREAFKNCYGLTQVTIPHGVTDIKEWAFSGCSGLTSVTIPDSVTRIWGYAFEGCSGLTELNLGNGVTRLD